MQLFMNLQCIEKLIINFLFKWTKMIVSMASGGRRYFEAPGQD